jgi:Hydantoinase/oxoprolinase N-terminal region
MMRLACDTGGTFTDLVVEDGDRIQFFKASTTPDDPVRGVLDSINLAAEHYGVATGNCWRARPPSFTAPRGRSTPSSLAPPPRRRF